jgi:hypothetical protein
VIPALRKLRQKDLRFKGQPGLQSEFKASLGYTARPSRKEARAGEVTQW